MITYNLALAIVGLYALLVFFLLMAGSATGFAILGLPPLAVILLFFALLGHLPDPVHLARGICGYLALLIGAVGFSFVLPWLFESPDDGNDPD